MTIAIKRKIKKDLREVSQRMGITEHDVVDRALLLYLESVKKITEVQREFEAWDALSDESFSLLSKRTRFGL